MSYFLKIGVSPCRRVACRFVLPSCKRYIQLLAYNSIKKLHDSRISYILFLFENGNIFIWFQVPIEEWFCTLRCLWEILSTIISSNKWNYRREESQWIKETILMAVSDVILLPSKRGEFCTKQKNKSWMINHDIKIHFLILIPTRKRPCED